MRAPFLTSWCAVSCAKAVCPQSPHPILLRTFLPPRPSRPFTYAPSGQERNAHNSGLIVSTPSSRTTALQRCQESCAQNPGRHVSTTFLASLGATMQEGGARTTRPQLRAPRPPSPAPKVSNKRCADNSDRMVSTACLASLGAARAKRQEKS